MSIGKNWLFFFGDPTEVNSTVKITHFGPFGFEKNDLMYKTWLEGKIELDKAREKWGLTKKDYKTTDPAELRAREEKFKNEYHVTCMVAEIQPVGAINPAPNVEYNPDTHGATLLVAVLAVILFFCMMFYLTKQVLLYGLNIVRSLMFS